MANRSDFLGTKLPRYLKRMVSMGSALGYFKDQHSYGVAKRAFIDAHKSHVAAKTKRFDNKDVSSDSED
jgi:hypothetical protein